MLGRDRTGRSPGAWTAARRRRLATALVAGPLLVAGCSVSTGAGLGTVPSESPSPGAAGAAAGDGSSSSGNGTAGNGTAGNGTAANGTAANGTATAPGAATALSVLRTLPVKAAGSQSGYTRAKFGQAWADTDHNGCDTRNDILARDMRLESFRKTGKGNCVVLTGRLTDPYTGTTIQFTKSKATRIQIDHVVALSAAWRTGASAWTTTERTRFANDRANLLAVDGPTNEAKGDSDASQWLPPSKSYRCAYVGRQIGIKAKYKLWVTPAERDAMRAVLSSCPSQRALSSG